MKITLIAFCLLSILASSSTLKASPLDETIFKSDYFEGQVNGDVKKGNLSAALRYRLDTENGFKSWIPRVEVSLHGKVVGVMNGIGSPFAAALVQIAEMDNSNQYPEVVFSYFTGGAHCCNEVVVLTSDSQGKWFPVELAYFDGDSHEAQDIDNDGIYEYVDIDNRFLYRFTSYAGSSAPTQIWQLKGSKFFDVTHEPRFTFIHRRNLNEMSKMFSDDWQDIDPNGFLAAYVANKALVGEFEEGWNLMLKRYDKNSDWGLSDCKKYDEKSNCLQEVKYKNYPEALRAFLIDTGYIKK